MRYSVFANDILSVVTRQAVYEAIVLLHGAETWTLMAPYVKRLTIFHNHCVRIILGITRYEQGQKHLTSATLLDRFGFESISRKIMDKRLCWLAMLTIWVQLDYQLQALCCLEK